MDTLFDKITETTTSGQACVLVTVVENSGAAPGKVSFKMLVLPDGKTLGTVGGGSIEAAAIRDASRIFQTQKSELKNYDLESLGMCCGGSSTLFFDYFPAARTLLIFGGGHCGQALYKMAPQIGFRVVVFDNRPELKPQFVESNFILCDLDKLPITDFPGSNLYAAIMTYNHQFDYSVLRQLLICGKTFEYVGLIGSANKVKEIHKQLVSENIAIPEQFYSPIGLNIGAQTPAEIAVAILGELVGVINKTNTDSLRNTV
ncbi:MAG: XdhC/CoxI family protein [Candidatus Neomarinimicrobiota bacterium]